MDRRSSISLSLFSMAMAFMGGGKAAHTGLYLRTGFHGMEIDVGRTCIHKPVFSEPFDSRRWKLLSHHQSYSRIGLLSD